MNDCRYCSNGDNACKAVSTFMCTREGGHDGPHVACGVTHHALEVWENLAPEPGDRAQLRALADGAERDGATVHLAPAALTALLYALVRAEARAEARAVQTAYWRERAGQPHERVAIP